MGEFFFFLDLRECFINCKTLSKLQSQLFPVLFDMGEF